MTVAAEQAGGGGGVLRALAARAAALLLGTSQAPPPPPPPSAAALLLARARAPLDAAAVSAAALRVTLPYARRLQLLALALAASAALLHAARRAAPPGGARRVIAALLVVALNLWLPLLFDRRGELLTRVAVAFTAAWLGAWKALGLAANRGPLAAADWSPAQLLLVYALPLYPRDARAAGRHGRLGDSAGRGARLLLRFVAQTALCVGVAVALAAWQPSVDALRYYLYGESAELGLPLGTWTAAGGWGAWGPGGA